MKLNLTSIALAIALLFRASFVVPAPKTRKRQRKTRHIRNYGSCAMDYW